MLFIKRKMEKNLAKLLAFGGIGLLMLSACKKEGALVTSNGGKPGALTASTTTPVLDKSKLTDATAVITLTFTAPNYGFSAAVTNTLQIDAANDSWAHPMSVTLSNKVLSQSYSTADFNALLLKLNLVGGVQAQVNVRIMHTLNEAIAPVYSNVVALTVTPFNLTSWIYVAGAFEGWTVPGPGVDSLVSATSNGIYTGIVNFTPGNLIFKILVNSQNYTGNIGSDGTANGITSASSQSNLAPPVAGQTLVTVNMNNNTISYALADYYSVIGGDFSTVSSIQWTVDYFMKYVNDGNGTWAATIPVTNTAGGGIKIRQDAAWTFSWGVPNSGTAGFGVANTLNDINNSNGNIPVVAAGNHNITFIMPATPLGSTPAVTTTYTLTPQ